MLTTNVALLAKVAFASPSWLFVSPLWLSVRESGISLAVVALLSPWWQPEPPVITRSGNERGLISSQNNIIALRNCRAKVYRSIGPSGFQWYRQHNRF